jgi:prophage regulatory protein
MDLKGVDLMGVAEIRVRLGGLSRQRAWELAHRHGFPEPRWKLAMGHVWLAADVEAWIGVNRPDLAGH